jgi:hypothetical protein
VRTMTDRRTGPRAVQRPPLPGVDDPRSVDWGGTIRLGINLRPLVVMAVWAPMVVALGLWYMHGSPDPSFLPLLLIAVSTPIAGWAGLPRQMRGRR